MHANWPEHRIIKKKKKKRGIMQVYMCKLGGGGTD